MEIMVFHDGNDPADFRKMVELGIDYVNLDELALFLSLQREMLEGEVA
jgi:hypothetical protein